MSNSTIYEGRFPSLTDFVTQATGENSIAIGHGAKATLDNELVIQGNVNIRVVMTPEESTVVKRLLQRAINNVEGFIPIRVFGEKTAVVSNDQEIDESQFETVVRWMRANGRIYAHAVKGFAEIKYDSDGGLTVKQQKLELLKNER